MTYPDAKVLITTVPMFVTHPLGGLIYSTVQSNSGNDILNFKIHANGIISPTFSMNFDIQTWNYPPRIPLQTSFTIVDRQPTLLNLPAVDNEQGAYIGVYIKSMPKKGKLYQVLQNGTKGNLIEKAFSAYSLQSPIYQYASKVVNVSSFWGGSLRSNSIQ